MRLCLLFISFFVCNSCFCQFYKITGKVLNGKQEPLAFASVQIKEYKRGTVTKEDGTYQLNVDEGKYDLIISLVGYKTQIITVIITKADIALNVLMEISDVTNLSEVVVNTRNRDNAEEYIKNVIRNKDAIEKAAGNYSYNAYIKAVQHDSMGFKKSKKLKESDSLLDAKKANAELNRMAMAEILLQVDNGDAKNIKEQRTGISKRGNTSNLFYLSTTEADFNIYNNIINVPSISQTPFLSPLSYSGLIAYKFKTLNTEFINGKKVYTISIKPRQLSNATIEGVITIADSIWVVLHTKFTFPKFHLAAYDFFEVEQDYTLVNETAWMITKQQFTYNAISNKKKASGITVVNYNKFQLNKIFDKKYFNNELSASTLQAYERDSSFWKANRSEPLTEKEVRFVNFKDSSYRATHTKAYLDSMDAVINKITWKKVLFFGQNFNNHEKKRSWYLPALPSLYQPLNFGGARIQAFVFYNKTFKSKKNIFLNSTVSYGIRNKDVNGNLGVTRMYNPFNRGSYSVRVQRDFANIFIGDAWINLLKRSNVFLNQSFGLGHNVEVANGLFIFTDADIALRRSVSNYKTNNQVDSLLGDILTNNQAVAFEPYNALYGTLKLEYTFKQKYIREPREKIILGSKWPTVYALWRKGVPNIFKSKVDFDYIEFGLKQNFKMGILGTSSYTLKSGKFINKKDLRLVDYKFQRRGDPFLFLNPNEAFQALDSTFPIFNRFYEGHYLHEFNGALLNKIPFFKKVGLREIAGAGFLLAPDRNNLRYAEVFAGVEKVFKYPFNQLGKFKVGVYVVGSAANQFKNPVQFKFGITTWNRRDGKWN